MALSYVIQPLPAQWPGKKVAFPKRSQFKTQWSTTLRLLDRELKHLGARNVVFHCDVRGDRDIRQDGQLRADARPGHRVIVAFSDKNGRRLQFPCDTFAWWQDNVYAVARALEALRMVERYGVSSTSQYEGFKALPSSTTPALSTESAAAVIARRAGAPYTAENVIADVLNAKHAIRRAAAITHPDGGGTTEDFQLVQEAKRVLEKHHGVSL